MALPSWRRHRAQAHEGNDHPDDAKAWASSRRYGEAAGDGCCVPKPMQRILDIRTVMQNPT
jgi:hypothetical protein